VAILKTEGIILRTVDFRESSKIVTCYTRDFGKLALIAKGAKRLKSRIGGALDLLNHVAIVLYRRETREIQTLSSAEILHTFPKLQEDLNRFSLALAAAEFVDRMEQKEVPNPKLFRQLIDTLQSMESAGSGELLLLQFIWRWLEGAGFRPKLRRCLRCGQPSRNGPVYFSVSRGGYYCEQCVSPEEDLLPLPQKSVELLLFLRDNIASKVAKLRVSPSIMQPALAVTWRYLQYHTELSHDLKSLQFLRRLKFYEKNGSGLYVEG